MMCSKKVAIITLFYHNYNYGGVLQAYALQKTIEQLGYICDVVNLDRSIINPDFSSFAGKMKGGLIKIKKKCDKIRKTQKYTDVFVTEELEHKKNYFENFMLTHVKQTESVYNCYNVKELVDLYDIFVCGSDQVWSPVSGRPETFLSFVPPSKKKISYAASIGADAITHKYAKYIKPMLKTFNAISVRESSAKQIIDSILKNNNSVISLDPTLLLTVDEWDAVSKPLDSLINSKYILMYFIGEADTSWELAYNYAKTRKTNIVNIAYNKMKFSQRDYLHPDISYYNVGPSEFLWLIKNAECVLTDSFHGTVFSIIYQKPLYIYKREHENANGSMNGRIDSLLNILEITENISLTKQTDNTALHVEDYSKVKTSLEKQKKISINFLEQALHETK